MMNGWKAQAPKQLKKVVYALNENNLNKVIAAHEARGWQIKSEVKEYRNGVAVLMYFPTRKVI